MVIKLNLYWKIKHTLAYSRKKQKNKQTTKKRTQLPQNQTHHSS